jgi:hypothetical protein
MSWELTDVSWHYPFMIKFFIYIFTFSLFWLCYYFLNHYILVARLKKHIKIFRNLQMAKTPDTEIEAIIDQQLKKTKNPQIKDLYLAFSALSTTPSAAGEHLVQKHKREIDYFLSRRELQIKGLAIVLVFSMFGLILMEAKLLLFSISQAHIYKNLSNFLSAIDTDFYHNLFQPLAFSLPETFLVFCLINSLKKLRLWLDHEWANLIEESASGEGK